MKESIFLLSKLAFKLDVIVFVLDFIIRRVVMVYELVSQIAVWLALGMGVITLSIGSFMVIKKLVKRESKSLKNN